MNTGDNPGSAVGIDRGVAKVATRSDGRFHHQVFARDREVEHVRKLQRDVARTTKGSARRKKAVARVAHLTRKIRRRREDFAAKTAHAHRLRADRVRGAGDTTVSVVTTIDNPTLLQWIRTEALARN
ncbi:transposase [Nonomuraea purpurea]|uniref:Transposase n=1 Tax=Nonomuraea purpurea TaxID=1849276 RepID=A0ABV8GDW8_9ACTN